MYLQIVDKICEVFNNWIIWSKVTYLMNTLLTSVTIIWVVILITKTIPKDEPKD